MIYEIIEPIICLFIGFCVGYQIGRFRESLWWSLITKKFTLEYENKCHRCIFKLAEDLKSEEKKR